jgi:hypothetical protein
VSAKEVVAATKRRGKRKPLPADLPRIEVVHELPDHELTCACGCRKHSIGEEISEQFEIVSMQIRVIKHVRKVYACRGCETAPVTADKPAQLIEKSMASPSVFQPGAGGSVASVQKLSRLSDDRRLRWLQRLGRNPVSNV